MRDIVFMFVIAVACAAALAHPWIGVLTWTWISVMNPHAYTWAAQNLPVAAMVGGATLLGLVITRDRIRFYVTREMVVLAIFMAWMTVSLIFAFNTSGSYEMWAKVMKIDFMLFITLAVLYTKRHIMYFVIVVVFSLAFYGAKGGLFTLATGGEYIVWGPGGFIGGNNEMALALVMVIPLTRFLQLQTSKRWIRHGLTLVMILTAASALGSHSRGALLAILGMAAYFWLKSRQKFAVALVLVLVGIAFVAFLPADWWARMNTIGEYEQDASAMGRINAWWMTFNLAKDRLTGGGFDIYDPQIFAQYAPDPSLFLAAHSIYFQILGEHGFPGLALFLLLWILVWRSAGKLARHRDGLKETSWCRDLGAMTQASLMGYAIGGAFLSLAYFDLPYDLMVMVILTQRWVQSRGWEQEPAHSPAMPAAVRRLRPSSKVVT